MIGHVVVEIKQKYSFKKYDKEERSHLRSTIFRHFRVETIIHKNQIKRFSITAFIKKFYFRSFAINGDGFTTTTWKMLL